MYNGVRLISSIMDDDGIGLQFCHTDSCSYMVDYIIILKTFRIGGILRKSGGK